MSTATGEDLAHLRQNRELPLEQLHLRLELLLVLQNISHLMDSGMHLAQLYGSPTASS